jgi:phosphohistidine phosphatase
MPVLLLVRHAIAEARGEAWPDDSKRPLTLRGKTRMAAIAARLFALGESAEVVLTSPLTRAQETARVIEQAWTPAPALSVLQELAPGHAPQQVAAALGRLDPPARMALVGHEPDLGLLAAWLLGARQPLPFKKGGVARIDVASWPPQRNGQLRWLASPKILINRD